MRKRVCVNMTLFGSLITHGAPVSGEESSAASAAQRSDERGTTSHTHTPEGENTLLSNTLHSFTQTVTTALL